MSIYSQILPFCFSESEKVKKFNCDSFEKKKASQKNWFRNETLTRRDSSSEIIFTRNFMYNCNKG